MDSEQLIGERSMASVAAASMTRDESHGLQIGGSDVGSTMVVRDDMATQGHRQARESSDPVEADQHTMKKEEDDDDEEEDPLVVAQREQEEKQRALEEAADVAPSDDPAMKAFYADMKEVDRENEVNRILGAFRLNPFEMLGLRFDATDNDIRRQYRKVSLTVHPDKCNHPNAKNAFEIIGFAQKELLDEEKRERLDFILNAAREEVRAEWRKSTKHDAATRVATILHDGDKEKVYSAYEDSDEFHEAWKMKARDFLAKAEWRRRKLGKRLKNEEEKAKQDYETEKEENKRKRENNKAWEATRESRVGSWRDFAAGKSKKKKKVKGMKPPKSKVEDSEKLYVQRPLPRP